MKKPILRLFVLSSPLLLAACGEGWEMQRTGEILPYGNQRTAGTGVAYVRAKMLPKKELKVENIVEEKSITEQEPEPVLDAEEIFTETQVKGSSVKKKKNSTQKKGEEHSSVKLNENTSEELVNTDPSKLSGNILSTKVFQENEAILANIIEIEPLAGDELETEIAVIEQESGLMFNDGETYENKISQPLKHIIVPKKDFFDFRSDGKKSLNEIYQDEF